MNRTTVQNVVTYDTVIDFANPDLKLFPGMTAYITIPVAEAQNVLRVPNGALRYKPDLPAADLRALLEKNGIGGGGKQNASGAAQPAGTAVPPPRMAAARDKARAGVIVAPLVVRLPEAVLLLRMRAPATRLPRLLLRSRQRPVSLEYRATIWKLTPDKQLQPVQIKTGITDHTLTEVVQVLKGSLNDGDQLVTGSASKSATAARAPGVGAVPGGGGPPRGR